MSTRPRGMLFPITLLFAVLIEAPFSTHARPEKERSFSAGQRDSKGIQADWKVRFATREAVLAPPNLVDYATRNEPSLVGISVSGGILAGSGQALLADPWTSEASPAWGSLAPATLTLSYGEPFVLERLVLKHPTLSQGFSDFSLATRTGADSSWVAAQISSATTSYGRTRSDGFIWEIGIRPIGAREVRLVFNQGTLENPDRVFLQSLDLWGRKKS